MQVTRFAAPLAYNYLHVIRMQEYLGSDRVRLAHLSGSYCITVRPQPVIRSVHSQHPLPRSLHLLLCGPVQATVFAQEMGTAMHDVPVFGTNFNTWFPLVVVVYCTLL